MNKRTIAREWLLFLAMLPLGFPACLLLGFQSDFDYFWNWGFGFVQGWSWLLWLLPYILALLIRSIVWAIKACANSN